MKILASIMFLCITCTAIGAPYRQIAKSFDDVKLSQTELRFAQMQGECLVGLKEINFREKRDFDAVAEWTNYRSLSLLEQFPPCTVLVMMETARRNLLQKKSG